MPGVGHSPQNLTNQYILEQLWLLKFDFSTAFLVSKVTKTADPPFYLLIERLPALQVGGKTADTTIDTIFAQLKPNT